MDDYTIDQIYENLELIEEALSTLRNNSARKIDTYDIAPLNEVLVEMAGGSASEASTIGAALRLPAVPLRRIIKFENGIDRRTAQAIAERLRTHFKMLESNYSATSADPLQSTSIQEKNDEEEEEGIDTIEDDIKENKTDDKTKPAIFADGWILVHKNSSIQSKIATITDLISIIISNVERSNLPEHEQLLNSIEKKQLIAILETALEVLKAPMVEVGLLKKARQWLGEVANKSAQEQAQQGIGHAMTQARELLGSLLKDWNIL